MNLLKSAFRKNGLLYQLICRNDLVAMYGVGGTYTNKVLHYEVCGIRILNNKYGHRERLPSNEQFGKDGSIAFLRYKDAIRYFDHLSIAAKSKLNRKIYNNRGIKTSRVRSSMPESINMGLLQRKLI